MTDLKSQFNEYLQEQSMISMEQLLGEDQKPQHQNKQEGKKGRNNKRDKNEKFSKKEMAYVPKGQKAAEKAGVQDIKWQPKAVTKSPEKLPSDDEMNGTPSYAFLRKIYNLMNFKQDQLNEIQQTELKIQDKYGGDIKLAKSQTESGAWAFISKTQFEQLSEKKAIQASIEQYNTIFNIYRGFHHKTEKSDSGSKFSNRDCESLALLMTLAQNSQQLIMYLQYQQALRVQNGQPTEALEGHPQIADVQKIIKFYNSMTFFGSFNTSKLESKENVQPTKNMNMSEKVEHVKSELKEFLKFQNKNEIENSIYCQDKTQKVTFSEIQEVIKKFQNNASIYKDMQITPNFALNQQLYPMHQMMFPFQQQMAAAQMQMSQVNMQMYQQPQVAGAEAVVQQVEAVAAVGTQNPNVNVQVPPVTKQKEQVASKTENKPQVQKQKPKTKFDWNEVEDDEDNNQSEASPVKQEPLPVEDVSLKTEVPQYIPQYAAPEQTQQNQQPSDNVVVEQNIQNQNNFYQAPDQQQFEGEQIQEQQNQQQWQQYDTSNQINDSSNNNWNRNGGGYENRNYGGINVRRGGNRGTRGYNRGGAYQDQERTTNYTPQDGNSRGGYQQQSRGDRGNYRGYRGNRGNRGGGYNNYRNKYDQNQDNQGEDFNNQQLNSNSQEFNQEDQGNFKVFQRNRGGGSRGGYQKQDNYSGNQGDDQQQQYYSRSRGSYGGQNQYQSNTNYQNNDGNFNPFYRNTQQFGNETQENFEETQNQFTHYSNNNQDNQKQI